MAEGDAVTDRLQTTREYTLTLLRAAWPNVEEREESDDTGTRVVLLAEIPPCRGLVKVVDVSARTINTAWARAMTAARKRVESELPRVDQAIAQAEIEADRLRKQRRRIIDTLNGFETEVTK